MHLPAECFENPPQGSFWDSRLLHECLLAHGATQTLRTTERLLEQADWLPDAREMKDIRDELERPLVAPVAASLAATNQRQRTSNLILQTAPVQGGHVVVANDGRGGRRWVFTPTLDVAGLAAALKRLADERPTWFWPHGSVTALCRALRDQHQHVVIAKEPGYSITLALPAYRETLTLAGYPERTGDVPDTLTHLDRLEAESMHIMREVVAQAENPVMLYSVGKDSAVMLHLARKAFYPSPPPFPLLHVDTRWKFQAMYDFRDQMAKEVGMPLLVHVNPEGVAKDINPFDHGSALHTDVMKTQGLKQALDAHGFDVAFGGARRDEEKSRAKERVFSFRNAAHRWDPKNQRPELWNLYNAHKHTGESIRVFPLSNWTELDIWQYIYREQIPIVPLYFAAHRPVVERGGLLLMVDDERMRLLPGEEVQIKRVRFRTLGCYPLTGAFVSDADDLASIVLELLQSRTSERQGRAIDTDSAGSMEKKKQEGYF